MIAKPTASPEQGAWTSRLVRRGGSLVLHLAGPFHSGWAGVLAGGLAARRVGVVRGWARRAPGSQWTAELELEVQDPKVDPAAIDCLALIRDRAAPAGPPGDLRIDSYRLAPRPGGLEVTLGASDAPGLLERVLRTFAFFGLFPCELRLETRGAVVEGTFLLQALGQTEPRLQVIDGLDQRLASLLERSAEEPQRPGGPSSQAGARRRT